MNLEKFFVGLDQLYNMPFNVDNYPRYNIGKFENGYEMQMALPGWSPSDINITLQDGMLKVTGEKQEEAEGIEWRHKGISSKSFTRAFKVDSILEVKKATFNNGMLTVTMEFIPETEETKIPIEVN